MRDDSDVQRAAATWRLALPRSRLQGRSGEIAGSSAGSSLEFHEYRQYLPGDDVRNLDWSAYGRTDQLMIRLHREELSPRTEILLDASASMDAGGGGKWQVARQIAATFALLGEQLGGPTGLLVLDDRRPPAVLSGAELTRLNSWPCGGRASMADALQTGSLAWQARGLRIVVSDFLFAHDPASLVRRLADGAGLLWMIQTVTAWELQPTVQGGRRLVDPETDQHLDLVLTPRTVASYQERLQRLRDGLERSARLAGAAFVTVVTDRGLAAICRDELLPRQLLEPAD